MDFLVTVWDDRSEHLAESEELQRRHRMVITCHAVIRPGWRRCARAIRLAFSASRSGVSPLGS